MNDELKRVFDRFATAKSPEDIFGKLSGTTAEKKKSLQTTYQSLIRVTDPNKYVDPGDKETATKCSQSLNEWLNKAIKIIDRGTYGDEREHKKPTSPGEPILIPTNKRSYGLTGSYKKEGIYNVYPSSYVEDGGVIRYVTLNIVVDPKNNDLALNEADILNFLYSGKLADNYRVFIPKLLESFYLSSGDKLRHVNVYPTLEGWYSLKQVSDEYKYGVNPKDMAWIFRRLLAVLGFAHLNGIVHGAIVPENVLVLPEQHGLLVQNWMYALDVNSPTDHIQIIPKYKKWYSKEVLEKESVTVGSDVQMAAKNMIYILGGDIETRYLPKLVPILIKSFLERVTSPGKDFDAWNILSEFDGVLEKLWGPRKFHQFSMRK